MSSLQNRLKNKNLLIQKAFIGGQWTDGETSTHFSVKDPATEEQLAVLPDLGRAHARAAIAAAQAAQPRWAALDGKQRSACLRRWYDAICQNQEDLASIITAEMGKPLAESRMEVLYGASFIEWFAEEGKRIYGDILPQTRGKETFGFVLRQPVGVVAAITPWNFPNAMIARKIAPALAAGCTVVLKPSELTPLSALALAALAHDAGVPPGVINILTTSHAREIGLELCTNPVVRKISFTGSTRVGRFLMRHAADDLKRLSLELGGNAPFIVFPDADIDAAVEGALQGKFRNSGQTCVCPNRFYVHKDIHKDFTEKCAQKISELCVGSGFEPETQIGPLVTQAALEKVETHISDAREKGADILFGGTRHPLGKTFFTPTLLTQATAEMRFTCEETFGPVAPVFSFDDHDDVIALANTTPSGLAGYFYTQNAARIFDVTRKLDVGMVGVNTGMISNETAPFGGVKQSGFGREGSKYGIDAFITMKYMCWKTESSKNDE